MNTLALRMAREQPRINRALRIAVEQLPGSVRPAVSHALEAGGKRLRPFLTVLLARFFGCSQDNVYPLAAAVELLHTATLLHDDVLDNAPLRRGRAAVHRTFGVPQAILAGDAMLAHASHIVAEYGNPKLTALVSEAVVRTAGGEILELAEQGKIPADPAVYYEIITGKTAWMIRAACEMGALYAGAGPEQTEAAGEYGLNLGIAFQVVDDALDFAPSAATGKPEGGDVREGKCTPPVLLYLKSLQEEEQREFRRRFAALSFSDDEVIRICGHIREQGFHKRSVEAADGFLQKARLALHRLERSLPSSSEGKNLADILDFVRDRTS